MYRKFCGVTYCVNLGVEKKIDLGSTAFRFKHIRDVAGCAVAEKLAQSFFVVGDGMAFDYGNEISGCVAGQRGFGKVRVARR